MKDFRKAYQRLELATITPFSIEKLSHGNPARFQACILIGSPRVLLKKNSSEHGIFLFYGERKRRERERE